MSSGKQHINSLAKKTALVTGGAGGIGFATVRMLQAAGAQVVIADTKCPPEHEASSLLYKETDISSAASIAELYDFLQSRELLPDVIVCNAGRGIYERLAEGDPEKWLSIFNINVMGHLRTIRSFLPQMLEKEWSSDIVFISSVAARKPHEWGGIYAASKAALQSLSETLRLEVQPKVRVSTILPGMVETDFFNNMIGGGQRPEEAGWGSLRPQDVAEAVEFILSRPPEVAVNEITIRPAAQPF